LALKRYDNFGYYCNTLLMIVMCFAVAKVAQLRGMKTYNTLLGRPLSRISNIKEDFLDNILFAFVNPK